jgi:ceramide glucosyltransferase
MYSSWLGIGLFAASLLNRMIECWLIGWWAARDSMAPGWVLLYPLRDLYGFVVWCVSYIKQRCLWRDTNYRLLKGGKLVAMRADGSVLDPKSARSITPEAGRI